jgi:hypothetical protein
VSTPQVANYQRLLTKAAINRAVPGYAACLAMKNQARIKAKEFPVMVVIAAGGWTINHFAAKGFPYVLSLSRHYASLGN